MRRREADFQCAAEVMDRRRILRAAHRAFCGGLEVPTVDGILYVPLARCSFRFLQLYWAVWERGGAVLDCAAFAVPFAAHP